MQLSRVADIRCSSAIRASIRACQDLAARRQSALVGARSAGSRSSASPISRSDRPTWRPARMKAIRRSTWRG
jgi:hypothetical protein